MSGSPKVADLRDELVNIAMRHPFLRYRINSFEESFASVGATRRTLDAHRKKLDWQIRRIYRVRNEIVHADNTQADVDSLVAHAHEYLISLMDNFDLVFRFTGSDEEVRDTFDEMVHVHRMYENRLRRYDKDSAIKVENFRQLWNLKR